MQDETRQQLDRLAAALEAVRGKPQFSYVLFVGGGASTIQGHPVIDELRQLVLLEKWGGGLTKAELSSMTLAKQIARFDRIWSELDHALRTQVLNSLYEKLTPTEGHRALALLLKEKYFPLVLTTAMDPHIENAFITSTTSGGRNLRQTIFINGRDLPEAIQKEIQAPTSDTIIVKLYGDLQLENFAATQKEVETKLKSIELAVKEVLKRDLVIVGLTPFDSEMIRYLPNKGGSIYFIGTEKPLPDSFFEMQMRQRSTKYIVDKAIDFVTVFETLTQLLNLSPTVQGSTHPPLPKDPREQTPQPQTPRQPQEVPRPQTSQAPPPQTPHRPPLVEVINKPPIIIVKTTVFTIEMQFNHGVNFHVINGVSTYTSQQPKEWNVDVDGLNIHMQEMGRSIGIYLKAQDERGRDNWRWQIEQVGRNLYIDLMRTYPELNSKLELERRGALENGPESLALVFISPRRYMGIPFELLHDGDTPLVVRYPLCRKVNGVATRHTQHFDDFIRTLQQKKQSLKVLLMASDTGGSISSDKEVAMLKKLIEQKTQERGLKVDVHLLPTEKASLGEVKKRLSKCSYHIVHYAGHGGFDETTGENSGLRFWQRENRGGNIGVLTVKELADSLTASETRLFYLSACVGTWTGGELLRNNEYLGIMDAIVQKGVPYVLGFRWSVSDSGAQRFAELFYDRLFTQPFVPERAIFHARHQIYDAQGSDETWTSPILVAQNPYH